MEMQPVKGSEETIPADLVLIAAGFTGAEDYVIDAFQVKTSGRGTVDNRGLCGQCSSCICGR